MIFIPQALTWSWKKLLNLKQYLKYADLVLNQTGKKAFHNRITFGNLFVSKLLRFSTVTSGFMVRDKSGIRKKNSSSDRCFSWYYNLRRWKSGIYPLLDIENDCNKKNCIRVIFKTPFWYVMIHVMIRPGEWKS